jgi:hypothetical protein
MLVQLQVLDFLLVLVHRLLVLQLLTAHLVIHLVVVMVVMLFHQLQVGLAEQVE